MRTLLAVLMLGAVAMGQAPTQELDALCKDGTVEHNVAAEPVKDICSTHGGAVDFREHLLKPEPLLVPAVNNDNWKQDMATCIEKHLAALWSDESTHDYCIAWVSSETCTDKTRILLHSEDGRAWCLATPKEGR